MWFKNFFQRLSISILLFFAITFTSCRSKPEKSSIIIEGRINDLPDGKIYLSKSRSWRTAIDSTQSSNGHFRFDMTIDSNFIPYRAVLHFHENSQNGGIGTIRFRNPWTGANRNLATIDAFYAEPGIIRIEGSKHSASILAGKENEIFFRTKSLDFGWIALADSNKRNERFNLFEAEIRRNPDSYFLLESIYHFKEQYKPNELQELLSAFNPSVRNSAWGDSIRLNLNIRSRAGEPLELLDSSGKKQLLNLQASKLNIFVFWASWCGPCRREIPLLKELYATYHGKGINLVNISIDEALSNWKSALAAEKMPWKQFIVERDKINYIMQQLNFTTIPFTLFTGPNGVEIARFDGFDGDNRTTYTKLILQAIAGGIQK